MPLYTCNIDRSAGNQQGEFVLAITNLHVKTFGGDRDAVRVEFIIPGVEGTRYHYVSSSSAPAPPEYEI